MQSTFAVALERALRLAVDVRHCDQHAFRIVPSSAFDCRKVPVLRGGGGLNTCASALCLVTQGDALQVRGLDSKQVGAPQHSPPFVRWRTTRRTVRDLILAGLRR